jgi:hypothetical protein
MMGVMTIFRQLSLRTVKPVQNSPVLHPIWDYTCAYLIRCKEERWQPQEFPNQPPKTQ